MLHILHVSIYNCLKVLFSEEIKTFIEQGCTELIKSYGKRLDLKIYSNRRLLFKIVIIFHIITVFIICVSKITTLLTMENLFPLNFSYIFLYVTTP